MNTFRIHLIEDDLGNSFWSVHPPQTTEEKSKAHIDMSTACAYYLLGEMREALEPEASLDEHTITRRMSMLNGLANYLGVDGTAHPDDDGLCFYGEDGHIYTISVEVR